MKSKKQDSQKIVLSIIIPVYHEENNIRKVLSLIKKEVRTSHETLIVYFAEDDPTIPVVKKILKEHKNIKLVKASVGNRKGVMNQIKTGFLKAKGKAVVVVMGDLADDVSQIDSMYSLIQDGYDIVCASRFMKGGKKIGGPILKTILAKIASLSLLYLKRIPTHDATNAYKMYRRSLLKQIRIESTAGFEYSLEIIEKAFKKGYKITEIPTVWRDREEGKSNFKILQWLPKYMYWYMHSLFKLP